MPDKYRVFKANREIRSIIHGYDRDALTSKGSAFVHGFIRQEQKSNDHQSTTTIQVHSLLIYVTADCNTVRKSDGHEARVYASTLSNFYTCIKGSLLEKFAQNKKKQLL